MNYQEQVTKQNKFFATGQTKNYYFRRAQLQALRKSVRKYEQEIAEALRLDLGKTANESYVTEIGLVLKELSFHIKHLRKMMKVKRVKTPLALFPAKSYVYQEPYGTVLIVAPWNYPFLLAINPLIGALSAGNTAIIKPSEFAVNTAKIIEKLIKETFTQDCVTTVLGGIPETTALLENKFDYLFFTGSPRVGKIMMQKMSETLTPCTLELGGKSPAVVTKGTNLKLTATRIAYGKTINAGQTCIAPDYLLLDEQLVTEFTTHFAAAVAKFYGDALTSNDYPKIINQDHHTRLLNLIKDENVIFGGESNKEKIAPTLVLIKDKKSPLMAEEIFGPILPIVTYQDINEAYAYINHSHKPLAAYLFTNDKAIKDAFIKQVSAGGIVLNDTLMHFANNHLPFGGVGNSGIGKYHGHYSFKTFSHAKAVLDRKTYLDIKLRYHPFSKRDVKLIKKVIK